MQRREFLMESGRAALGFSLAPMALPLQGIQNQSLVSDLEQEIAELLNKAQVPGLSIALVKDGALLWRRGFGVKDIRSKAPVDDSTVFQAASTTKPVFAYAVMKLCEKRVMDLDTPLTKYAPARFLESDPLLDRITARHVLSHTSGLPNWRSKEEPAAVRFTPGDKWGYSGEGYSYLQSAVSHLTGARVNRQSCARYEAGIEFCATDPIIDEYMQRNILVPFGMASSGFLWSPRMEANTAWGHDPKGLPLKTSREPSGPAVARYGMAGGLFTTPSDYARFLMEVIAPKPSDEFRLSGASLAEMLRPHVKVTPQNSWALGWEISHTAAGDVIRHSGGNPGYSCFVAASVERKSGYVIMTNSEDNGYLHVVAKLIAGNALPRFLGAKLEG